MGTLKLRPQSALTKERALEMLFDLGQTDYRSFEASKKIRSQKFTDLEVYALWRIATDLSALN